MKSSYDLNLDKKSLMTGFCEQCRDSNTMIGRNTGELLPYTSWRGFDTDAIPDESFHLQAVRIGFERRTYVDEAMRDVEGNRTIEIHLGGGTSMIDKFEWEDKIMKCPVRSFLPWKSTSLIVHRSILKSSTDALVFYFGVMLIDLLTYHDNDINVQIRSNMMNTVYTVYASILHKKS